MRTDAADIVASDPAESLDRVSLLMLVGVGGLLLTKTLLAANAAFEADEYDAFARGAELLADPAHRLGQPHRLLASAIFAIGVLLGQHDAVVGMVLNRVVAVISCVAIYLAVLRIGGRVFGTLAGVHALVGLGMVQVFIDHSFTARSDFLWLTLCTVALALLMDRRRLLTVAAGVALGLAYLVSLKALLMLAAVGAGVTATVVLDRRRAVRDLALTGGGFVAVYGVYLILRAALYDPEAAGVVGEAVNRVQTLTSGDTGVGHTKFYWAAIRLNPLFAGISIAGLILAWIALWRGAVDRRRDLLLVLVAVSLYLPAMQLYPHAWPYFIATAVPGLALTWGALCGAIHRQLRLASTLPLSVGALVVLAVMGLMRPAERVRRNLEMDNGYQVAVMDRLDAVLGEDDTYFDGVGLIPTHTRTTKEWLDVVALQAYRDHPDLVKVLFQDIASGQTGAIVVSWRTDALPPEFQAFREQFFVQEWGNIFVPGQEYDSGQLLGKVASLPVLTEGEYRIRGESEAHSALRIDGAPMSGPTIHLSAGEHRISAVGDVGAFRILRLDPDFVDDREPLYAYKTLFPRERFLLEH